MSREKSVWFAEEILLDAKLINCQLENGELNAVEEMLRAEAQLSRDSETGRLRPKKASEYTLRLIAEVLHLMKMDIEEASFHVSTLAVVEQCLRLIRSCAASGMKIQTYISKDLNILDDMLTIFTEYQHPNEEIVNEELAKQFDSCMVVLTQTLGNLVVNNPFNQTIVWEKFGTNILNALIGQNENIASCAAMIVYNILLGQPNVLPDDVLLLNALAYMYTDGNSEFPHLIIEYLIGVENSYIEKLYNRLEPETRLLILNLAYNILMMVESQDINVSVNFIKFIAHEFKVKSDCILKTVDKYVNSIEPQEVVYLLDIIATASSMETYMGCLQSDVSLFTNCSYLLQSIHKLGKQEDNFFSSIHKLYQQAGRTIPENIGQPKNAENPNSQEKIPSTEEQVSVKKCDSTDMLQCNETVSECTESESSEQYFECMDQPMAAEKPEPLPNVVENIQTQLAFIDPQNNEKPVNPAPVVIPEKIITASFPRQTSIDRKSSDACKINEDLIKVAFAKCIKPDVALDQNVATVNPAVFTITEGVPLQNDVVNFRRISMDHKIDIMEDMEPPLITDSPEESKAASSTTPNVSRKTSVDTPVAAPSRKVSVFEGPNMSNTGTPVLNLSRQQSVEPENTAVLQNTTQQSQSFASMIDDISMSDVSATSVDIDNCNTSPVQQKVASEPTPVKKSQNVSTEFDLSEQLQKILGISGDKAIRSDSVDVPKPEMHVIMEHPKVESQTAVLQPPKTPQVASINAEAPQPVKKQVKIPNFKIDSPENYLKSKMGTCDASGPKKVSTVVESVEQHVAFGFKATLIRTLGNLCWKHELNKKQVRELEVIPILLDCCNIDARNPLIMQWVILAVRNICDSCPENQKFISSLQLRAPINNEVLSEMGLALDADVEHNSIRVVPLHKKPETNMQ